MTTTPTQTPRKPLTRRELEALIIAKAWRNPAYKKRLSENPKAVLQEELKAIDPSIKLPDSLQVQVHEEDPDLFHLVVPRNPADISLGEVVGDNLEAVAPQTVAVVVVVAAGAVVAAGTVAVVTHLGAANVVGAANATVTANAVANYNTVA
ncbi:MAG: NHLP leader peptide family RiPP precursor [Rhodospirillaceae bacterium]